jgi:putative sulfotransferase
MNLIPEIPPVFIVGTGRCGSTMLSNMLREHPAVLSLSEFLVTIADFGGRISHAFPQVPIDGTRVWSIIAGCHPKQTTLLRKHCEIDEMIYPLTPRSRFSRETGVPAIMFAALPHLTARHDVLFDELREFVLTLDPAHAMRQYERIFEWLKQRFNRRVWVERSGGSLRAVPSLARRFPAARFIHVVRDGRDCSLSMSRHHGFRLHAVTQIMTTILGDDPFENSDRSRAWRLPARLRRLLPEQFDAETFRNLNLPPALFGLHWSREIRRGIAALAALPADRVLTIHFENLLENPAFWLRRMAAFIHPELVQEQWLRKAVSMVHVPRSSWKQLPAQLRWPLALSCRGGLSALSQRGLGRESNVTALPSGLVVPLAGAA